MKLQTFKCNKTVQGGKINMICPDENGGAKLHMDDYVVYVSKEYMAYWKPSPSGYYVIENGIEVFRYGPVFEADHELVE